MNNRLHIVYDQKDNGNNYETYYKKYNSDGTLEESKQVTDYGSEVGGFPTVSVSPSRVHVSYNSGNSSSASSNQGTAKTRDKYNTTWQTPQLLFSNSSMRERVHAGSSKLFEFYYKLEAGYHSDLYVRERSLGSTSWSSSTLLQQYASVYNIVSAANTNDGKTHIVYEGPSSVAYRNYNGSSWTSETTFGSSYISPRISSTSNDLFVIWGEYNDYLKIRQYDANPPKPINLSASASANDHPYIIWDASICADFKEYKVYKRNHPTTGSWTLIATTTNNYYEDQTETIVTGPPIANEKNVYYAVREVDQSNNYSSYSDMLTVRVEGPPLDKISNNDELDFTYELFQNYPNPFNPSTKIQFQIPKDGYVSLIVYNSLGEKVASLVEENLTSGKYSFDFDAENLPSGIYIYRLIASDYTSSQKMLLIR
ncbi:MAG: T9SS type A sorting domain-containing protein [Melioribacteraceae bacterium]|nr:T9SS type A sorting domain-containing protein [Melioribacteraceae bacterium]